MGEMWMRAKQKRRSPTGVSVSRTARTSSKFAIISRRYTWRRDRPPSPGFEYPVLASRSRILREMAVKPSYTTCPASVMCGDFMYHSISSTSRRKISSTSPAICPSPVWSNVLKMRYVAKMVPLRCASAASARSRRENDACTEKTSGKMVPTATMFIEKSNEKSSIPLAQKRVAVAVQTTMKNVCHVDANRIPSHTSAAASRKRDQLLVMPPSFPVTPLMRAAMTIPLSITTPILLPAKR
mmetsp:Transcript_5657/g.13728  ORF Transcript_5657/g.13728 Transcript_5657/m.13728 type:complete len:240 (-) Transcript_5657:135-854(-)